MDSNAAIMELQTAHALRDSMRFTLIFLAGDSIPLIHPLDIVDDRAAAVLDRSVWPQKPTELWAIRVRVAGGPAPTITLERATYCPPEPTSESRQAVDAIYIGVVREQRMAPGVGIPLSPSLSRPFHAVLDLMVSDSGTVSHVKMINSSGNAAFDQGFERVESHYRFYPAMIDSVAVPGVYRTDRKHPRP